VEPDPTGEPTLLLEVIVVILDGHRRGPVRLACGWSCSRRSCSSRCSR